MVESTRSKLKPLKIVLWSILGAILLFVLIVVSTLLVQKYVKKTPVPMFAGCASMIVITGSMSGTIEKGDMVIVKRTNDYKLGDIVTYVDTNGEVVTHRIVNYGSQEGTFVTKGDANPTTDGKDISVDQIAGEVVLTIPKVGWVFDWFLHGGGIIYTIALLAIIVAAVYFWNVTKPEHEAGTEETVNSPESTEEDIAVTPEANTKNATEATATSTEEATVAPEADVQPNNEQSQNN